MHGFFASDIPDPAGGRQRLLVLFCSCAGPDEESLAECLREHCDERVPPDRIIVVAPRSEADAIRAATEASSFQDRIPSFTRFSSPPLVEHCFFESDGTVMSDNPVDIDVVRRRLLTAIFQRRGGLLTATATQHYVKPSDQHCSQFLRTGNVLVDGSEVEFMAFCCLQFVPEGTKHIYCDTGAISPIAYAINTLRLRLATGGSPFVPASIDSFGSYAGARNFKFRSMPDSVVMLSATTSEGLARYLTTIDPNITPDRIVTVFSLTDDAPRGKIVCDLRSDAHANPDGLDTIVNYAAQNCPLCRQGSQAVRIVGDQFLPGEGRTDSVVLRGDDLDQCEGLRRVLRQVVGKKFVHANHRGPGSMHASKEVYFDLMSAFSTANFLDMEAIRERFERIVDQSVPAMLQRIIHLDDPASEAMAKRVADRVRTKIGDVPIIRYGQIAKDIGAYMTDEGATVVVAGAVASGRSLLGVAQLLRKIQRHGAINYIVGLSRMADSMSLKELRTNVTYGSRPSDFGFHVVEAISLPVDRSDWRTTWEHELEVLNGILNNSEGEDLRGIVESRIAAIRHGSAGLESAYCGMRDELFWPSQSGTPLQLRRGFAFFDFEYAEGVRHVTQADVYLTIVGILHGLRTRVPRLRSLRQTEHVRTVLSPRNFDRFNDGVIQAAILRAARPAELDYSASPSLSSEMRRVLEVIFDAASNEAGEAAREFALAIAMSRLNLMEVDRESLRQCFETSADPIVRELGMLV